MVRGLIGGALWGAVVGVIVMVAASLLLPPPGTGNGRANVVVSDAPPPAPTVAVSPATPFIPDAITAPATTPDGRGGAPALPRAGSAAAVAPDPAPPEQEPPQRPVRAETDPGTIAPAPEDADTPGVVPAEDSGLPAEATAAVAEASTPAGETAPEVETAPHPVVAGAASGGAAIRAPQAQAAALVPAPPPPSAPDGAGEEPEGAGMAASASEQDAGNATASGESPEAAAGRQAGSQAARVGTGFSDRAAGVRVNRPGVSGQTAPDAPAEPPAVAGPAGADLPAFRRHAAAFDNPEGRPVLAVVIVDLGTEAGGLPPEELAAIPFPVTIAIPVGRPDAAGAAAAFRTAGFEIAMIPDRLPELAAPADVEVAFAAFAAALPDTVGVLEPPDGGFPASRAQAEQVVAILAETGQALISFDRGLDNALRAARRAGLPAAVISRDLDAAGEGAEQIRRALDRAAFRAQQEGGAVVLLRSRPGSVSALLAWAQEGRAARMALAPVTAVMGMGGE